jgi:hypothetical protein
VLESATVTDSSGNPVDLSALSTAQGQAELDELEDAIEQAAAVEAAEADGVEDQPAGDSAGAHRAEDD